jgi:hypothetical protein
MLLSLLYIALRRLVKILAPPSATMRLGGT